MSIKQQKYLQMCQLHIALSENHSTSKEISGSASIMLEHWVEHTLNIKVHLTDVIYRNMLIIGNVNCAEAF